MVMFISEILDNPIRKSGCYADDVVTGISGMDKAYLATTWFIRPKDGRLRRALDHFQGRDAEALLPLFERKMRGYKSLLSDDKPEPMWLLHDTMLLHLLTGNVARRTFMPARSQTVCTSGARVCVVMPMRCRTTNL